jgi:hypothetical protein
VQFPSKMFGKLVCNELAICRLDWWVACVGSISLSGILQALGVHAITAQLLQLAGWVGLPLVLG